MGSSFFRTFISLVGAGLFTSCTTTHPKYQLSDDFYLFKTKGDTYKKAFAYVSEDTILVYSPSDLKNPLPVNPLKQLYFAKPSFDVDVMTVPFKYRRGNYQLPRQLTNGF
jgi:hypothetical protein